MTRTFENCAHLMGQGEKRIKGKTVWRLDEADPAATAAAYLNARKERRKSKQIIWPSLFGLAGSGRSGAENIN